MRQMTATVYILHQEKVLLIFHKKLQKWLPPGGHLLPNELPPEGAVREVEEETGLKVQLISQENVWIEPRFNGKSFERPYMCLLEHIPEYKGQPAHEHVDFIYIASPIGGTLKRNDEETDGLRWFSLNELDHLEKDVDIFEETYEVITHLMNCKSFPSCPAYASL